MKNLKFNALLLLLLMVGSSVSAQRGAKKQADKDTHEWKYELECAGVGLEGTYLVKVWTYSANPTIALEQAKKNAVHGVIFKGVSGGAQGCMPQPPLSNSSNLEQEKQVFFQDFFAEGGKYLKFVNLTAEGEIAAGDVLRITRKEYKVGVVITVNKSLLQKDLIDAGVLRSLSSGF